MAIDRQPDDEIRVAATEQDEVDADGVRADESDVSSDYASGALDERITANPHNTDGNERYEYHIVYRAMVDAVYLAAARERWEGAKLELEAEWRQYADEHPAPRRERPGIDEQAATQVEQACKEIRETEVNIVTPAMTRIEAEDPERKLVGLEFRCKGQDRIMEKVAAALEEQPDLASPDALAAVKDAIRYTFQYSEQHYTEGVLADIDRLKADGFELFDLRNSWAGEEYKGVNSRWWIPETGMLFEVQFHTEISFEAKQLTHQAYERIRSSPTTMAEQDELVDFQRRACVCIPEPRGVRDIPNYPRRRDAEEGHVLRDR